MEFLQNESDQAILSIGQKILILNQRNVTNVTLLKVHKVKNKYILSKQIFTKSIIFNHSLRSKLFLNLSN